MWRAAGAHQVLQLIVIAPLAYRSRQGSKLLYRRPAFFVCTDENLDPQRVIETSFHRWDIELNFRGGENPAWRRSGSGPLPSLG
jgi:hypothetical protein